MSIGGGKEKNEMFSGHGKYLGIPEQFRRKKSEMFRYII